MNAALILEELNKLDDAKQFVSFLEIKFIKDEQILNKLKSAKKSLDKAFVDLVFDLSKKLENSENNNSVKIRISDEIINAFNLLESCGDLILNQTLLSLVTFAKDYENDSIQTQASQDHKDLKNLKTKILLMISERFW